jgi:TolA-binding protein
MIDPPRLMDDGDAFDRALLGSARRDHGSVAAEARCVAAIAAAAAVATKVGIVAAATSGVTSAAATSGVSGVGGAAAASALGAKVGTVATIGASAAIGSAVSVGASIAIKAVAIGFAIGLSVQGAIVAKQRLTHQPPTRAAAATHLGHGTRAPLPVAARPASNAGLPESAAVTPESDAPARARDSLTLEAPSGQPGAAPTNARVRATNSAATAATPVNTASASEGERAGAEDNAEPADALEREVRLVDEARQFCRAGGYDRALLLLDRHQREYPGAALGPEALVIRVQALLGLGRRSEAEQLARPFTSANPSSPISKRLVGLLGVASPASAIAPLAPVAPKASRSVP